MSTKSHVRPGYATVTTGINAKNPEEYIAWAQSALGAEPGLRFVGPDGKITHSEIRIGNTILAVDRASRDPETTSALFHVYVADVDAAYKRAVSAGAKSKLEPTDMFFGERLAVVADTQGNNWNLATHTEDLSVEEIQKRGAAFHAKMQQQKK